LSSQEQQRQPRLLLHNGVIVTLEQGPFWIAGRAVKKGKPVDVDLTPHGAYESGVSRTHIRISRSGDQFTVEDLNSWNETTLNGDRLIPGQPYALRSGDVLYLGRFRCLFSITLE